jgi:hypothetical protein
MNTDLFINYQLQREELLARIAEALQLDETKKQRMESAYGSISSIVNDDQGFFKGLDIDVYPQGSVASGTTTKPLSVDSCHVDPPFLGVDPPAKQAIFVRAI